jgi:predicted ribosome quality control (RQC) complex YloA/Tae2 family protein
MATRGREDDGPTDADAGVWRGRSIARRFVSPDGWVILVGRTAEDNDVLSLKLASPRDFWLHVSGDSGSHVVIRNPEGAVRPPRETVRYAAGLAAGYSKARHGGQVSVHLATCADVSKPRGLPPGKVQLRRFTTVRTAPLRADDA